MSSKLSPKYWDEHPEVFIKDLADRLALQNPTCGDIMNAVINMIHWTGSYADMSRTEEQIKTDMMKRADVLIKAAINDALQFFGDTAWEFCDRWGLDEDVWMETLEKIIGLVRFKYKTELEDCQPRSE